MEVVVNGGLREKKGKFILTIYSSPFARYLLLNGIKKMNLEFNHEEAIISNGESKSITIERKKEGHPLVVTYVSKLLSKDLKDKIRRNKEQLPIRAVIREIVSEGELLEYNNRINRAEPKIYDVNTPKSHLLKVGCFISCFRQNNRRWYRFSIRHRIFEQIFRKGIKVDICREGDDFLIKKNSKGNEFHFYKNKEGHPLSYMQISPAFLKDNEKEIFKNGRSAISFKAFLCSKDFGLDISEFFYDKKERELAKDLLNQGVEIRIPEMGKREADILLPEINGQIEVTTIMPANIKKNKNNAHGSGVHINARLCEGFVRVVNNKINKFFVVLHKSWMDQGWVRDTYEMIKPRVILLPTDFEENWSAKVAEKIIMEMKK